MDMPPINHLIHDPQTAYCVVTAAKRFNLPIEGILGILLVENGKVGSQSDNRNKTRDMGPMQINTLWLNQDSPLYGYVTEYQLTNNICVNIHSAAWIIADQLKKTNDIWLAIGKYHAPYNQEFAWNYKVKVNNKLPIVRNIITNNSYYRQNIRAIFGDSSNG